MYRERLHDLEEATHGERNLMSFRADPQNYTTKVTALGYGFGCRVFKGDKVVAEGWAETKSKIAPVLRELLRTIDKCGNPSEMASASRIRNYTKHTRPSFYSLTGALLRKINF